MMRRGLTLLELMLAIVISAMVAGAIAGMLGAVSSGVSTRRDNREIMVLAHSAQCRLSAYLGTSRCVLAISGGDLTLWLDDSRASGTVHASEIRWLRFDPGAAAISVEYLSFPPGWTQTARELADNEYAADSDWEAVRAYYAAKGLLATRTLVDQVTSVSIDSDEKTTADAVHLIWQLSFDTGETTVAGPVSGTIQEHQAPMK